MRSTWRHPAALLLLALLFSPALPAATITGKVVKVVDGDTVHVLDAANTRHKIRLAGIDAPERKQPFGAKAKAYLAGLVAGEPVEVEWNKRDRYKRIVGKIIHDGRDVNLSMVRAGMAWWYRKYSKEQSLVDRGLYAAAEAKARFSRVGLWADPGPVAPWEWRRR